MNVISILCRPKKKAPEEIKLIKNDKNNKLYKAINAIYKFYYIISSFTRKLLWFGSCGKYILYRFDSGCVVAFMYIMPMSFEIFTEQQRVLQKIQMQMMNDSMMGGADMGPPQMRPF